MIAIEDYKHALNHVKLLRKSEGIEMKNLDTFALPNKNYCQNHPILYIKMNDSGKIKPIKYG